MVIVEHCAMTNVPNFHMTDSIPSKQTPLRSSYAADELVAVKVAAPVTRFKACIPITLFTP